MRGYLPSGERLTIDVPPLIPGVSQFRNSNGEVDLSLCMADPAPREKRVRKPKAAKKKSVTVTIARKKTRRGKRKPKSARL